MLAFGAIGTPISSRTAETSVVDNIGKRIDFEQGVYGGTTSYTRADVAFDGFSM